MRNQFLSHIKKLCFFTLLYTALVSQAQHVLVLERVAEDPIIGLLKKATQYLDEGKVEEAERCFAYIAEHASIDGRTIALKYLASVIE